MQIRVHDSGSPSTIFSSWCMIFTWWIKWTKRCVPSQAQLVQNSSKCIAWPIKLPCSSFPSYQGTVMHCQQISLQHVPEWDYLLILSENLASLHPASQKPFPHPGVLCQHQCIWAIFSVVSVCRLLPQDKRPLAAPSPTSGGKEAASSLSQTWWVNPGATEPR